MKQIDRKYHKIWFELPRFSRFKIFIEILSKSRQSQLLNLSKNEPKTVIEFFTGHCSLRRHLHLLEISDDSLFTICEEEDCWILKLDSSHTARYIVWYHYVPVRILYDGMFNMKYGYCATSTF